MPFLPLIRRLTFCVCACMAPWTLQAEEKPEIPETPVCSVVTVAPGDSLDALFGHTAIRIRDPRLARYFRGTTDVWFDYGVFDQSDWTFWIHYAKGDAKYLLVAADPQSRLDFYKAQGRAVVEQKLDLTAAEAQKLEEFLLDDLENGCGKDGYDYRFLDDNCTTRAKEAIERATGQPLKCPLFGTYRDFSDLHMDGFFCVRTGANLLMGHHAERPSGLFLPIHLQHAVGGPQTLESFIPAGGSPRVARQAGYLWWMDGKLGVSYPQRLHDQLYAGLIGLCLLLFCALPTLLRWKKRKPLPSRGWLDALLFAKFGLVGCLMTFLGFWSHHPELGAFNWNLIWCWPTHLVFAFLLLFSAHSPATRIYARVAAVGAICAALAYFFVPQALPLPLFPLVLLLGLRAARWGWSPAAPIRTEP